MSRVDPIQYAERLYAAIRGANFSPISFLAFGTAVKDGVELRRMPRIAAEPFMRVVGEMVDLEASVGEPELIDADVITAVATSEAPAAGRSEQQMSHSREPTRAMDPAEPRTDDSALGRASD